MGSGFDVSEAKRRQARFYHAHIVVMRTLAGWIIQVPEFEVKTELGHHIYAHAEAARLLRERLSDLLHPDSDLNAVPPIWITLHEELLHAHVAEELVEGAHLVSQ